MSDVERADWMEIVTELRERAEAAEEQARVLGEALSEIARTPSRDWHLNAKIARAALAGSVASEPLVECDGGPYCKAVRHMHGCFADKGNCDHPSEHAHAASSPDAREKRDT